MERDKRNVRELSNLARNKRTVCCRPSAGEEHMDSFSHPFKVLAGDDSAIYRKVVGQSLSAAGCAILFLSYKMAGTLSIPFSEVLLSFADPACGARGAYFLTGNI